MSISISGNGSFTGATADYSFDQSVGIAGTLTYEDVTSIDSVGVITARSGINVGPTSGIGITLNASGSATFAGDVQVGGNPHTETGVSLRTIGLVKAARTGASDSLWAGYTTGNSSATSEIYAGGSALFKAPTANGVEVQTVGGNEGTKFPFVGKNTSGTITFKVNGDGTVQSGGDPASGAAQGTKMGYWGGFNACRTTASNSVFVGYTEGNASATVDILANGNATFAGEVVAGVRDTQGVFMTSGGAAESFVSSTRVWSLGSNGSFVHGSLAAGGGGGGYVSKDEIAQYANSSSSNFFRGWDASGGSNVLRIQLKGNGGIANYQANDSNLCDEREKKNIVSLETKWDKVKSWELKKFHYNEDADTDDLKYGVIAQQVEEHCPEVLTEWEKEEGVTRKGVKEQQMMWMAIKALQEAMTKIETLEAKVATLEGS